MTKDRRETREEKGSEGGREVGEKEKRNYCEIKKISGK